MEEIVTRLKKNRDKEIAKKILKSKTKDAKQKRLAESVLREESDLPTTLEDILSGFERVGHSYYSDDADRSIVSKISQYLKDKNYEVDYDNNTPGVETWIFTKSPDKKIAVSVAGKSIEVTNVQKFKVGDVVEWSGLYGGSYEGKVLKIQGDIITLDVSWIAEDTGEVIHAEEKYKLLNDEQGKEVFIVWEYRGEKGYVYPPFESLDEAKDVQYGVHQFSTGSIIFRGTEEECIQYIDKRRNLWDDAEVYEMTPDDPHYMKENSEGSESDPSLNEEIVSSLQKDAMHAVNELAPSAMKWREGHEIRHTKTDVVGEFKGYKKNPITGSTQLL